MGQWRPAWRRKWRAGDRVGAVATRRRGARVRARVRRSRPPERRQTQARGGGWSSRHRRALVRADHGDDGGGALRLAHAARDDRRRGHVDLGGREGGDLPALREDGARVARRRRCRPGRRAGRGAVRRSARRRRRRSPGGGRRRSARRPSRTTRGRSRSSVPPAAPDRIGFDPPASSRRSADSTRLPARRDRERRRGDEQRQSAQEEGRAGAHARTTTATPERSSRASARESSTAGRCRGLLQVWTPCADSSHRGDALLHVPARASPNDP